MFHAKKSSERRMDGPFERLNYHFGQMMTERDFRDQQIYYNEKRWMMNRYGIGWGVLHGLKVHLLAEEQTKTATNILPCVEIDPGFALDQYGNEIVVSVTSNLNLSEKVKKDFNINTSSEENPILPKVYIAVKYRECGVEPFRLPESHCCDLEADCAYSRTRESYEFLVSKTPWPMNEIVDVFDDCGCIIDSFKNLRNPISRIIESHPKRIKCQPVPLASVSFIKGIWVVDNFLNRSIAYSNSHIAELINGLISELWKVHAAGSDRRCSVPLLTQTIPGLKYHDGRTHCFENIGEAPFRITTDGRNVWCTDSALSIIHLLSIDDNSIRHISLETGTSAVLDGSDDPLAHGWALAYDGHSMWVTMPKQNALKKINVCTLEVETITNSNGIQNPEEIVFDGQYLWISTHSKEMYEIKEGKTRKNADKQKQLQSGSVKSQSNYPLWITRFDPFNHESVIIEIPPEEDEQTMPIIGMAFDGHSLWFAYNTNRNHSKVRRIKSYEINRVINSTNTFNSQSMIAEGKLLNPELYIDESIELKGDNAVDISFDGNALWIVHDDGASKIDISEDSKNKSTNDTGQLSSITFDGKMMWTIQNHENESLLRPFDLYTLEHGGGYELHKGTLGRMCFDGYYLWITGTKNSTETGKGIIYRILP